MSKPLDPMDPFDFRRDVVQLEENVEYGKRLFAHFGEGERFFRITSVHVDNDGDLIIEVDPNS